MVLGNKVGVKGNSQGRSQQWGKCSDESDEEYKVSEDEDCDESDGYCSLDSDESEEAEALERVAGSRKTHTISTKEIKKARKRRRVSYTGMDDDEEDEDEFISLGRKGNHIKRHLEKGASYIEENDEDDSEFVSSGWNRKQIRKSRQNRSLYTDMNDDDHETKEDQDEEGEDGSELISGRKRNQTRKPREKKIASYTEEDDEYDPEVLFSSRKHNLVKKPQEKVSVSCRDDDDDDVEEEEEEEEEDDDDDKEFILSESDFIDEDTEELKMMKNVKVSRYSLDKRDSQRGQKNHRKSKVLKNSTRPKRRNSNRKVSSNQISRKHLVNRQSKKVSIQQKRRSKAESDSDFVNSVSSDYEYTISEEEREQMREAKVYCETLRSKLRNSTATTQEKPRCEQRKPTKGKGKEKVEEMKDEVAKQVCGICLSEEGKRTVRGILNCCHHHFCFSCILEWSKVESRCPLCKQRFTTITKAAKSDTVSNSKTVVIPVPERDQIYEPSEEEVRRYLDPYETVICTECHNGGDDAFMLLCDICDSPAHTFCVGHGWEVPEGNWYCNGCTTPRMHTNASHRSSPVAGSFDLNETYIPEMSSAQETCILPEPTVATTLRDRRRIHRQIHHRFLNTIRLSDLIGRANGTSASTSSAGIRLFGSRLDQGRDSSPQQIITNERADPPHVVERTEDLVMPLIREPNLSSSHVNPYLVQVGNSTFMSRDGSMQAEHGSYGTAYDLRYGNAQLQPCTNISSIGSDSIPSPYTCREVIGSSRTPQSGLHTQLHGDQTSKVLVLSPHRPG